MTSPSDFSPDHTQSESSISTSPQLPVESKLRRVAIAFAEEEVKELEKKKKKEMLFFKSVTLQELLDHLGPYLRSVVDPKESAHVDMLINNKLHPRAEAHLVPDYRLQRLLLDLCGSVVEAVKEAYLTRQPVVYTIPNLVSQTKELLRKLDVMDSVEAFGIFEVDEKEEKSGKKYSPERIVRSIERILEEV